MDKNSETSLFLWMTSFVKFKKIKTNEKTTNSNTWIWQDGWILYIYI